MKKTVRNIILIFVIYYVIGFPLGFLGLQLRCKVFPMYSCETVRQYLTDPWLFSNTLTWPFIYLDLLS